MVVAQPTSIRVHRQSSIARAKTTICDELTAFTLLAEPEVLECFDHGDGEGVVDRRVVDITWFDARLLKGSWARPARPGKSQIDASFVGKLGGLAVTQDFHPGPAYLVGDFGIGHDHRSTTI